MKKTDENNSKRVILDSIIVMFVVAIIVIVIIFLTYRKEIHTTGTKDEGDTMALVCTSHSNDESVFFHSDSAISVEHTIKLVYNNDNIQKISYEYVGDYGSKDVADQDDAILHARYNTYMGEHDKNSEILVPVFQAVDNKSTIKLYLNSYKDINSVIGKLFYIGNGLEETIGKNSMKETKKYYEKKDFSCIINE